MLDILEHIKEEDIDEVINNFKKFGNTFLTSIPYENDPNYELDNTHVLKKSKGWWIATFAEHGLVAYDVPKHFLFKEQLLILRKDSEKLNQIMVKEK